MPPQSCRGVAVSGLLQVERRCPGTPEPTRQNIGQSVDVGYMYYIRYTAKREMRAIERRNRGMLEKSEIENREVLILMCDVYKKYSF